MGRAEGANRKEDEGRKEGREGRREDRDILLLLRRLS
jgi:hypothetical protein